MKKTLTFTLKTGETFEVKYSAGAFYGLVNVVLYKVNPNPKWWQFKKVRALDKCYIAKDFQYNFHQMGLNILASYLDERKHANSLKEMWEN